MKDFELMPDVKKTKKHLFYLKKVKNLKLLPISLRVLVFQLKTWIVMKNLELLEINLDYGPKDLLTKSTNVASQLKLRILIKI